MELCQDGGLYLGQKYVGSWSVWDMSLIITWNYDGGLCVRHNKYAGYKTRYGKHDSDCRFYVE